MRQVFIFFIALSLSACQQPESDKSTSETTTLPAARALDPAAKKFLIDLSNVAWFQAQIADAALHKITDTAMISMAQKISKQFIRIKDKAKIVSIPYQINMPYFLTHEQNDEVKNLMASDDASFQMKFIEKIKGNNERIMEMCNNFRIDAPIDDSFQQLIDFCKTTVENTGLH